MTQKELEELIDNVPDKYVQNPCLGHEYGCLQSIGEWLPDLEIQHDGQSRYVQVVPHRE